MFAASLPDPPTALTIDSALTSTTQASLTWTAPVSNGGSAIIGYQVMFDRGLGGSFFDSITETSTSHSRAVSTPGETYVFRVRSVNNVGTSAWSDLL